MPPALAGVAYVRVLGIAETIRAREADSAIAADLLAQARQLADAGINAAIDVTRNEVNLAAVRTQLVITRNQLARARLDLARALSIPPETPLVLADSLGQEDNRLPTSQDSAVAFAKEHRPEVLAEQRRTEAVRLHAARDRAGEPARAPACAARCRRAGSRSTGWRPPGSSRSASRSRSSTACAGRSAATKSARATTRRSCGSTTSRSRWTPRPARSCST